MKKICFTICLMLILGLSAQAQTKTWNILESGWGRIDWGVIPHYAGAQEWGIDEMNIHRWKEASGTLTINESNHTAVLALTGKKVKTYNILTDSRTLKSRDGWTYTEHLAEDTTHSYCRLWVCEHPTGAQRLLVLFPKSSAVYGYMITPAQ